MNRSEDEKHSATTDHEVDSYHAQFPNGWNLSFVYADSETAAWLTNENVSTGFYESVTPGRLLIALDCLGFVPQLFHEGQDAPPLVVFQSPRVDLESFVWEPASGRLYHAGNSSYATVAQTNNGWF